MIIESKYLKAEFSEKGAELKSLQDQFGAQYIWHGKENFWSNSAPILFPICGFLKENFFYHQNQQFFIQVHGFARTSNFKVVDHSLNKISFSLGHSPKSLQHFPFEYELLVNYEVVENQLNVNIEVTNLSKNRMYFSFGWHPGFALNWIPNDSIDNYYLAFPSNKSLSRRLVNPDGLLHGNLEEIQVNENKTLSLDQNSFDLRAIVLENYPYSEISLRHITSKKSIDLEFQNFSHLTLWGQKGADFLCIEPWNGLGDFTNHNHKINEKPGILKLASGDSYSAQCSVKVNLE